MAVTNKMYIAGSSTATNDFSSFFNEIKEIFIDMGHTYLEDESDAYKHVFKLDPSKYIYCGYEAKLTIRPKENIYNYLITDSLPTSGTTNDLYYLEYIIELSNGYYRLFLQRFQSNSNFYADFLNGNIPRYQSFREIQTDNIYDILIYSGAIQYSSLAFFSYFDTSSNGYCCISSAKYIDFNTGEETDMTVLLNSNVYVGPHMLNYSIIAPNIYNRACKKIITSPLWVGSGSSTYTVHGYVKDMLVTTTIEPYSKYTIGDSIYIPVDRSQHFLVKETSTTT